MAAISTPKISSIYHKIINDFKDINFIANDDFSWSHTSQSIYHPPINNLDSLAQLLHEIGHAQLDHKSYERDINLIDIELQAWQFAISQLAPRYDINLSIDDDVVDQSLDTYRDWLSARSTCPACSAIGLEVSPSNYRCLVCHNEWTVNEARLCRLRRVSK